MSGLYCQSGHLHICFFFFLNLQRVALTRRARLKLEVGKSERERARERGGDLGYGGGLPLPSRWRVGNHAPLKWGDDKLCMCFRLGCVHTQVGRCERSGVALGLHLPVCVYARGISPKHFQRPRKKKTPTTTACNSWSSTANVNPSPLVTELSTDVERQRFKRNVQLFQLGEWWSGPSSPRCARKKELFYN